MRWPSLRTKTPEALVFHEAGRYPWDGAVVFAAVAAPALLSLVGVDFRGGRFALYAIVGSALMASWLVERRTRGRTVVIAEHQGHRLLVARRGRTYDEIRLDELASVSREGRVDRPYLVLTDRLGASATIPLATWTDEARLIAEIADAARQGVRGHVGEPVSVPTYRGLRTLRIGLALGSFAALVTLAVQLAPEEAVDVDPVTPERVLQTEGETVSPFADLRECDVYLVPMDRPSEGMTVDAARHLADRIPASVCPTRSFALHWTVVNQDRQQVDADILLRRLADSFRGVWRDRASTVIGVTSLDLFSPARPDWNFAFGYALVYGRTQGHAVISTARMGDGDDRVRRLDTMTMRYVGFFHYGLSESPDPSSALYSTIGGLDDLDRMKPRFSDPPITAADLMAARERFLNAPP